MSIFDTFKKKGAAQGKEGKAAAKPEKKEEKKAIVAGEEKKEAAGGFSAGFDLAMILREPRITEKATTLADRGAYVFDVHQSATKALVSRAVKEKYGVTPQKVRMMAIPAKRRQSRMTGKTHTVSGGRKAVVYLKKGEKIEFV